MGRSEKLYLLASAALDLGSWKVAMGLTEWQRDL
jgi:hypothetical protein